jgi:hypothetical protein
MSVQGALKKFHHTTYVAPAMKTSTVLALLKTATPRTNAAVAANITTIRLVNELMLFRTTSGMTSRISTSHTMRDGGKMKICSSLEVDDLKGCEISVHPPSLIARSLYRDSDTMVIQDKDG